MRAYRARDTAVAALLCMPRAPRIVRLHPCIISPVISRGFGLVHRLARIHLLAQCYYGDRLAVDTSQKYLFVHS